MNSTQNSTCQSFDWTLDNKELTESQSKVASSFMRNAVNEFGCFKGSIQKVVANVKDGMKGEGWKNNKSNLTCLCPYGMTYNPNSTNQKLDNIIGENCVDVKAPNCINSIMGQCTDERAPIEEHSILKNVYLTWFWWPNLDKNSLQTYINMQIKTCHAMAKGPNGALPVNVNGLCFPVTAWPDQNNNLSFLYNQMKNNGQGNSDNRQILADWMYNNMFTNSLLTMDGHVINPGLLLYISFKDGPWKGFYSDYTSQINPLTGKTFGKYNDWNNNAGTGSQWVWGAFFHFMINYVCKGGRKLPENFWLHLDKEGSQSNDDGFSQQMYTNATEYFIGPLIENYKPGQPILYLATGVAGGAQNLGPNIENFTTDPTCSNSGLKGTWCNNNSKSVGVPEYYWGVGNQMPCDGSEGSYGYARTACTSLSSHRRLSGYPKQYIDLITGVTDSGSNCKGNGWLGMGAWDTAIQNAQSDSAHVWPSFSVENLSMCDLNDPNCYNQWTIEKQNSNSGDGSSGLQYTKKWGESTTICNSMLWGSKLDGGTTQQLKQGMKSCGVFDGFSHWTWPDFANFLHHFANKYTIPNLIIYEASFIPYHWLKSLGITTDTEWPWKNTKQESALLPPPEIPAREKKTCGFYNQAESGQPISCKAVQPGIKGTFCDPDCKIQCENGKNVKTGTQCGADDDTCGGGPDPGPNPGPNPDNSKQSMSATTIVLIILASIITCVLLYFLVKFLVKKYKNKKKYRKIKPR